MSCRSPLIHVEVDSKNQPFLYQDFPWSWAGLNQWTSPNLDSTRIALHHSSEVSTRTSHNQFRGTFTNLLEGLHEITFSKPSREQQLPRVTSRWHLLENSIMPQSSNSWCNALGCSHTHKNATSKQRVRDRVGGLLKYVKEAFKIAKRAHTRPDMRYI